jgi:hypothetical protein
MSEKESNIKTFINNQMIKLQKENLFFQESSLGLSEIENLQKIEGFFSKRMTNATLLFKASDHKFETSKFY